MDDMMSRISEILDDPAQAEKIKQLASSMFSSGADSPASAPEASAGPIGCCGLRQTCFSAKFRSGLFRFRFCFCRLHSVRFAGKQQYYAENAFKRVNKPEYKSAECDKTVHAAGKSYQTDLSHEGHAVYFGNSKDEVGGVTCLQETLHIPPVNGIITPGGRRL